MQFHADQAEPSTGAPSYVSVVVAILDPLRDIAVDVEQTKRIGFFSLHFVGLIVSIVAIPGILIELSLVIAEKIVRLGGRALPTRCIFPLRLGGQAVVLSCYSLEPTDVGLCILPAHIDNGLHSAGAGVDRDGCAIAVINTGLPLAHRYLGRGQRERTADGYGVWRQFHLEKWRGLERSHHEIAGR